ncbi:MAG: 3'-5' exonuclease [Pyrinomonadaceae bacterium]
MYKKISNIVYAFDAEWVPDPSAGRRVYGLPEEISDEEVLNVMWQEGGATDEDPTPFLKTILCRVVSVAAIVRHVRNGETALKLHSIPNIGEAAVPEGELIERFLSGVGKSKAQIVGFNSHNSDIPIMLQRGLANGISVPAYCERPDKPWEGVDYFARFGDDHIDLRDIVGGFGKSSQTLHELATVLGIPGKMGTTGDDVLNLWLAGDIDAIVRYNRFDALTTYLVWLRTVLFSGKFNKQKYDSEVELVRELIQTHIDSGEEYLGDFVAKWDLLSGRGD